MRRERGDHTLSATGLIHEAYLKLSRSNVTWESDAHFLNIAARTMRQVLVDHALAQQADKRGGDWVRLTLTAALPEIDDQQPVVENAVDVVALDNLLTRLEAVDARQAKLVELRFFAGLSIEETAVAMNLSPATVKREWRSARLFLKRVLST
jgi:RNA polymerase sigma-70 factor, ECF subfamily